MMIHFPTSGNLRPTSLLVTGKTSGLLVEQRGTGGVAEGVATFGTATASTSLWVASLFSRGCHWRWVSGCGGLWLNVKVFLTV